MENELSVNIKPRAVSNALLLFALSLGVGFINTIINEIYADMKVLATTEGIIITLLTYLILGFLFYQMNNRKNWARIYFDHNDRVGFAPLSFCTHENI